MRLRLNCPELMQREIDCLHHQAIDAHTPEDAVHYHSELVDLFSRTAITLRESTEGEAAKRAILAEFNACAAYHRDAVDRLTDIIEGKRQLVWRYSASNSVQL
jgi:hypothetical protein